MTPNRCNAFDVAGIPVCIDSRGSSDFTMHELFKMREFDEKVPYYFLQMKTGWKPGLRTAGMLHLGTSRQVG